MYETCLYETCMYETGFKGLAQGMAYGVAGLICKPTSGLLDLIANTTEGIRNQVSLSLAFQFRTHARSLSLDFLFLSSRFLSSRFLSRNTGMHTQVSCAFALLLALSRAHALFRCVFLAHVTGVGARK